MAWEQRWVEVQDPVSRRRQECRRNDLPKIGEKANLGVQRCDLRNDRCVANPFDLEKRQLRALSPKRDGRALQVTGAPCWAGCGGDNPDDVDPVRCGECGKRRKGEGAAPDQEEAKLSDCVLPRRACVASTLPLQGSRPPRLRS